LQGSPDIAVEIAPLLIPQGGIVPANPLFDPHADREVRERVKISLSQMKSLQVNQSVPPRIPEQSLFEASPEEPTRISV
jgi:hypothetical protein